MATVLTSTTSPGFTPQPETTSTSQRASQSDQDEKNPEVSVEGTGDIPPLGVPGEEKRFWFQRSKGYNPDAIATQVRILC
jgi:hypothetical protein